MARRVFPGEGSRRTDQTLDTTFAPVPAGTPVHVYTDPPGTIPANCLHYPSGDPVTEEDPLIVDGFSRIPLWQGPADDTDTLYVIVAGGPPTAVYAREDDRLDALDASVADVVERMDTYGTLVPWAAGDRLSTIQAALTAQDEAGGGTVRLEAGDHEISGTLDVPSGVVLVGNSEIGTTITCTASNVPIVTMAGGYNGLVDLRLRYQTAQVVANTGAISVRLHLAFKTRLERVTILGARTAIGLATTLGSTYLASCSFRDLEILGFSGWAIHLNAISNASTGSRFDNIYIHNNPSGTRDQAQGGIFLGNMSDSTFSTINVEHSKLTDPAITLSSVENVVFDGTHLEGLEPNADYSGLIGLFGGSTSVLFHQLISTFCYLYDANIPNVMPFFKVDDGVRLHVHGLKQRSWTVEAGFTVPLVYGTADLATANIWMRDVSTTGTTAVLAGSTTDPFREYNERIPTVRLGALTGTYGALAVDVGGALEYTPPGGAASDVLTAAGNLSGLASTTTARTNIGLGNVDNTSDANKPVSTATTTALGGKVDKATATTKGDLLAATASATIARLGAGTDGQVLKALAAASTGLQWAAGADVQTFTASGTWTKPAGATLVVYALVGGGGGGGSGRRGAAATVRAGGGSGAGGGLTFGVIPAAILGATETITVGAGGTGGAAIAVDSTDGAPGVGGGSSTIRNGGFIGAYGGGFGGGGTATGSGAAPFSGAGLMFGGNGVASDAAGAAGPASGGYAQGASGGGAGGGITVGNVASAGGNGGGSSYVANNGAGPGGAAGVAGTAGTSVTAGMPMPGGAGGGGGSSTTAAAGAGGAGGSYGAGGGGGGASANGFASGAGGAGAPGIVVMITV